MITEETGGDGGADAGWRVEGAACWSQAHNKAASPAAASVFRATDGARLAFNVAPKTPGPSGGENETAFSLGDPGVPLQSPCHSVAEYHARDMPRASIKKRVTIKADGGRASASIHDVA